MSEIEECNDPLCSCHQFVWMEQMDRLAQEELGARPRSEVWVPEVEDEDEK